jgi:hypothetical protein
MPEERKTTPMEIQSASSGWRHMPSPMGSCLLMEPKGALAPLSAALRQARAETSRRDALDKQRSRLAETQHRKN